MNIIITMLLIFIFYYCFIKLIFFIIRLLKKQNKFEPMINPKVGISPTNNYIKENIHESGMNVSNIEKNDNSAINYKKYYIPKRYVITENELNFYTTLSEIANELDLIVFSQVSLYNILETRPELDYKTKTIYFNKISSKSIDFVLVDKKSCRIKLCIELDDNTHKQAKRIERDTFINELFKELEIDLLRYPVYNIYYKEILKKRIQENIKEHYYES